MAYAASTDLMARYDARTLADLASDTGVPTEDLSSSARITAALEDASGRIDAAIQCAKQYTAAQLAALTGNSLALLKRITCSLAIADLLETRPEKFGAEAIHAARKIGEDYLDQLRKGVRIFVVEDVQDAQLPTIDGPTALDYEDLNLIPDRTRRYYPSRVSRLPSGREG